MEHQDERVEVVNRVEVKEQRGFGTEGFVTAEKVMASSR